MLVDIHIAKENGAPGPLHETIDVPFTAKRKGVEVEYKGRKYNMLTGVRAMIVVPREECK